MFTNQNKNLYDNFFMDLALMHAEKNLGNTKSNPSVGCVVVKNNCVISAGNTGINGTPHAEFAALTNSRNIENSNLYVTLEPCSHFGKTPPCVNKIIKRKIKKVFFSIYDPDFRSFNKSKNLLKRKGIKVNTGLNINKVRDFYRSYFSYKEKKTPFVTLKLAITKDFKTINRKKKWITNIYSRSRVHLMRSMHDCIITSSQTIIKDNPLLNCRIEGLENSSPYIGILDKNLIIPLNSRIINHYKNNKVIIFYNKNDDKKIKLLKKKKIKLIKISLNANNQLNLKNILEKIYNRGLSRVFLECGVRLASSFLRENLVNDFKIFISKYKIGESGSGTIKKYFKTFLKDKKSSLEKVNLYGEKLISYKIK
jgi:diaminohydroxyphosphoribosylaminopyrimidine deaminase/5-amino-6-(5-phosphoribosylamino)uracil reductase